jgi:zinc D-Ala-D-Ala carboxypeptidase
MRLTEHFMLEELTRSEIAVRKGLDNTPTEDVIQNLNILAGALERVRDLLGGPIHISSAYRSPKVNSAVGGSKTSAHLEGLAADFTCPAFGTPKEICIEIAASGLAFDQLIYEGSWVHLSVDPRYRQQTLTATFSSGRATYSPGLPT